MIYDFNKENLPQKYPKRLHIHSSFTLYYVSTQYSTKKRKK